jgi:hypothetical protein
MGALGRQPRRQFLPSELRALLCEIPGTALADAPGPGALEYAPPEQGENVVATFK